MHVTQDQNGQAWLIECGLRSVLSLHSTLHVGTETCPCMLEAARAHACLWLQTAQTSC